MEYDPDKHDDGAAHDASTQPAHEARQKEEGAALRVAVLQRRAAAAEQALESERRDHQHDGQVAARRRASDGRVIAKQERLLDMSHAFHRSDGGGSRANHSSPS